MLNCTTVVYLFTDRQTKINKMKTLQTLFNYLTEGELENRFNEGVRILLKIGRFSDKQAASDFMHQAIDKKAAGQDLTKQEREVIQFFTQYKRQKAPLYKMLQNAKAIHAAMPSNSKLTVTL